MDQNYGLLVKFHISGPFFVYGGNFGLNFQIIYKMDKYGHGVEFRYSNLHQNRDLSFTGFSKQMVLEMCILSGCDYLVSLPGMGLKKAHALIKKFKTYDKVSLIKISVINSFSFPASK